MKYIRTKDGRISYLSSEPNEEITDYEIITSKGTITYRREDEVIKQADTIEELVDGWVLESKAYITGFFVIYNVEDNKERMKNFKLFKDEKLFAFIKTDKGLIYVAKMNEKGDLELL